LKADRGFMKRWADGDAEARREVEKCNRVIAGSGVLTI
jgi:hypothetical protein